MGGHSEQTGHPWSECWAAEAGSDKQKAAELSIYAVWAAAATTR